MIKLLVTATVQGYRRWFNRDCHARNFCLRLKCCLQLNCVSADDRAFQNPVPSHLFCSPRLRLAFALHNDLQPRLGHNRVWWHEAIQTHVPMPMSLGKQTYISEVFGDSSLWKTSLHHHCRGSLNKICALPSALPNFHLGRPGPELDRSLLLLCSTLQSQL